MPHVEFGNLYKFVASIGLVLVVAAIVVPWLFAQSAEVLTIPADDLMAVTAGAQETLLQRQRAIAWVQVALPWVSGAMLLGGAGLLWWALARWRQSQELQDRGEIADVSRKETEALKSRAEVEPLPREAAEAKLASEVDETMAPIAAPGPGMETAPAAAEGPPSQAADERHARMDKLRGYEARTVGLLTAAYSSAFSVSENVRLTTGKSVGVAFDAFLDPKQDTQWAQLAIDVRALPTRFADFRVFEWVMRMAVATRDIGGGSVYTGIRGRPRDAEAAGALVFIVENDETPLRPRIARLLERLESANAVLRRPVGAVIVVGERFDGMSADDLRDALASVWSGASGHVVTLM